MDSHQMNAIEPENRLSLYWRLAQALNYPDSELAADLTDGSFADELGQALKSAGEDGPQTDLELLNREYGHREQADLLLELEKEYTRLCFSSKPRLVHLFESVYRTGKLMQECTFEIARLYYDAGLKIEQEMDLPPDHIATELEFLAYLVHNESKAAENGDIEKMEFAVSLQAKVIDEHLGLFVNELAASMAEHSRLPFYRAVASVLQSLFRGLEAKAAQPDLGKENLSACPA